MFATRVGFLFDCVRVYWMDFQLVCAAVDEEASEETKENNGRTFITMLPRSKSWLNKSSTVGLYLVSNFLNRNLFRMDVFLFVSFAFRIRRGRRRQDRGKRREATANVEHGHGRRMLLSASSFGQISPLDGGRRMAAPIRISISISIGISNVTHPVPSEPSRTSRKWNFSTSAVIITACVRVCVFLLFVVAPPLALPARYLGAPAPALFLLRRLRLFIYLSSSWFASRLIHHVACHSVLLVRAAAVAAAARAERVEVEVDTKQQRLVSGSVGGLNLSFTRPACRQSIVAVRSAVVMGSSRPRQGPPLI